MRKLDYAICLLNHSKECKYEYKEGVIDNTVFDWSVKSMGRFNNMQMIKKQIPFLTDVKLSEFSLVYSANSVLHLAIETNLQEFILKVLETNINLKTKRRADNATSLIIATKVFDIMKYRESTCHSRTHHEQADHRVIHIKKLTKECDEKELNDHVNAKDNSNLSALEYCQIDGSNDIYSVIKSFSTDGKSKINTIEYNMLPIAYKMCESNIIEEKKVLEEYVKEVNCYLNKHLNNENVFTISDFQYSSAATNTPPLRLHNEKEFAWIDTEQGLAELVQVIKEKHKVIGIDMEYYTFHKVIL
jgi:hypothetical protein